MSTIAGYDLIGDIHGHAHQLEKLLANLGYAERGGVYQHSERQVVFLGDFIDRGPRIKRVVEIARTMVEVGSAHAVMGNHEFNAIAFHTLRSNNDFDSLRARSVKNIRQHAATVQQLSDRDLADALDWFRALPMWLKLEGPNGTLCRAVHACWSAPHIDRIASARQMHAGLSQSFLTAATSKGNELFEAVEIVLKGKEMELPDGVSYEDKEGHKRTAIRTRWFEKPGPGTLYQAYVLQADPINCAVAIDDAALASIEAYPLNSPPVFVGHYWLRAPQPERLAVNVACLDYSVAKDGYLCAYRWDGEAEIDDKKFLWVM